MLIGSQVRLKPLQEGVVLRGLFTPRCDPNFERVTTKCVLLLPSVSTWPSVWHHDTERDPPSTMMIATHVIANDWAGDAISEELVQDRDVVTA